MNDIEIHPCGQHCRKATRMNSILTHTLTLIAARSLLMVCPVQAQTIVTNIHINPRMTYLHTSTADSDINSVPVNLSALGIYPGDWIVLRSLGSFSYGTGDPSETSTGLFGVFSSSSGLASWSSRYRVAGAIDAGNDVQTGPLPPRLGGDSTDIPEDFSIPTTGVTIQVPANALYLFPSAADFQFGDNSDANGDYVIQIRKVSELHLTVSLSSAQVQLCWISETNAVYRVDYKSSLTTNVWSQLESSVVGSGTTNCVSDAVTGEQRFYRAVRLL